MNPNLKIFFKRGIYVLLFAALTAGIVYTLPNLLGIELSNIGTYVMYGLGGLMIFVVIVLFTGLMIRVAWTSIMNRTDSIDVCCPDNHQDGIHLVCSHYNPGGESESFDTYYHYYIDNKGKLYLSKKVKEDGNDLTKSIPHLSEQTRLQLDPDLKSSIRIGSYDADDKKDKDITIKMNKGELCFRGYEGLIDYGFKVSFHIRNQTKWSVRI